jgi:recombination protein RecR
MSAAYTESLNRLIEQFCKLPGIGPKSAERLAFYILKAEPAEAMGLADAIRDVKTRIKRCRICYNYSEEATCQICSDPCRDKSLICVLEQPKDVIKLEKTGACKWVYHVLGGHIAPLDGVEPDDLTIAQLVERVRAGGINEISHQPQYGRRRYCPLHKLPAKIHRRQNHSLSKGPGHRQHY